MLRSSVPHITQLPIKTIIRQDQESLGLAVRIMREKSGVLAAQVHVAKQTDAGRIALQLLLRGYRPGRRARRYLEFVVANDFIPNALSNRLFGEAQAHRD